ncbi:MULTISPECIES: hypothetical protein [Methylobacterium]|uniref:Uncharacterized protein n=1 Tax=Methylobacterium jeotgali TaxID=381630 RepID=A0ABQ4SQZ7_9HYPH|nr:MULTISPECIES: hypothetical protein [Methylobacterium]PIU07441.1 MAG: hypothetical protein COT56_05090 [Methylobacterium sp. CG09_land_8_20_14_0_10_71_15]PIU13977.1 MAG: hypothetical protein COT28_09555 [Methylobacterium sp. CG08_land_8_20_14_0_20_71_15]GBU17323.1 hypothetical protein AwMethylo_15380 [Methylobacterium sp.]GJE05517.1 hypothetical protein AOPFMNJM_0817 [Methylobacterium jeotgali]
MRAGGIERPAASGNARLRGRAAAGRLEAARRQFERSTVALRRAAFDHVDRQIVLSTALRASLDRLSER